MPDISKDDLFNFSHTRSPHFKTMDFHSHDNFEIYVFADGYITYYIEEHTYNLVPGDILVIPPNHMHRPVVSKDEGMYERFVMNIPRETLQAFSTPEFDFCEMFSKINRVRLMPEEQSKMFTLLFAAAQTSAAHAPGFHVSENSSALIVLTDIARAIIQGAALPPLRENRTVPKVIVYINDHLQEKINLDRLAAQFYVSKYHLLREFKKYTHSSIYDYIITKRVTYAKTLITKGELLSEAAIKSGFSDYSVFYKNFTRKTGMTPKEYRNTHI